MIWLLHLCMIKNFKKTEDLLPVNWQKSIDQLKKNMEFWKSLPISMASAMKMVVLPRFLKNVQPIPLFITLSYLKQLDSIIITFSMELQKLKLRITKKTSHELKNDGGFGLPYLKSCYWAALLNIVSLWERGTANEWSNCPAWLSLDKAPIIRLLLVILCCLSNSSAHIISKPLNFTDICKFEIM